MARSNPKSRNTRRGNKHTPATTEETVPKTEQAPTPVVADTVNATKPVTKVSKKKVKVSPDSEPKATRSVLSQEDRERRNLMLRISSYMRRNEDTFKAVSLVLSLLEKSNETLKADELWSVISRHDAKYYQNVYKKRRNSSNPLRLANVKRPKTDYAFFTQDTYSTVAASNKDAKFGTISKIIKGMWDALPASDRTKYANLAAQDNLRYYNDKKHVLGMLDGSVKPKSKADKEIFAKLQRSQSGSDDGKSNNE